MAPAIKAGKRVAIERNGEIVPRSRHEAEMVNDGDQLEIVVAVGGSGMRFIYGNEQIKQLEIVLSRTKEANAILVGEEGTGKMDVVLQRVK